MTDQQKDQSSQKPKTPSVVTDKTASDKKNFNNTQSGDKEKNAGKDKGDRRGN